MSFFSDPYESFLLDYLVTKLENGSNTRRALLLYSEQITRETKFKKRLMGAIKDMEMGKHKLEAILHKHKFLNSFQYSLVVNSTNTIDGLKLVLSFKKANSNLLLKMINPIFVPMGIIISTFSFKFHSFKISTAIFTILGKQLLSFLYLNLYINSPISVLVFSNFSFPFSFCKNQELLSRSISFKSSGCVAWTKDL